MGTWYTTQSTNWTFDSTNTYLSMDFATYGYQDFECYVTDGYRYLARWGLWTYRKIAVVVIIV